MFGTSLSAFCDTVRTLWHFKRVLWHGTRFFENDANADFFMDLLETKGPFYVKLGQWLSERPDLIPQSFCDQLNRLKVATKPHSFQETLEVLRDDQWDYQNIKFLDISSTTQRPEPFSSASIAQVYRVNAIADGQWRECVLKVAHPHVAAQFAKSMHTVQLVYAMAKWYAGRDCILHSIDLHKALQGMQVQCDLTCEKVNGDKFYRDFENNSFVHIPQVYGATTNVVLEEMIHGALFYDQIGDPLYDKFNYYDDPRALAQTKRRAKELALSAYFQMMLVNGLVHGDCHKGNILYRLTPRAEPRYRKMVSETEVNAQHKEEPITVAACDIVVCFVDFGIAVAVDDEIQEAMMEITTSINANDSSMMIKAFERVLVNDYPVIQMEKFRQSCRETTKELQKRDMQGKGMDFGSQVQIILENFRIYRMEIDPHALRIIIGWLLIDGNAKVEGRNNNLPDNTLRWIYWHDEHNEFQLKDTVETLANARQSRLIREKHNAKSNNRNIAFFAPNLSELRDIKRQQEDNQLKMAEHLDDLFDEIDMGDQHSTLANQKSTQKKECDEQTPLLSTIDEKLSNDVKQSNKNRKRRRRQR